MTYAVWCRTRVVRMPTNPPIASTQVDPGFETGREIAKLKDNLAAIAKAENVDYCYVSRMVNLTTLTGQDS